MNILYISEVFVDFLLFESQVHTLCNLHAKTNNVTLLALCTKDEMKKDMKNRKYSLVKKRRLPKMTIPIVNKICSYFSNEKKLLLECDVIHCRGYIGSAYAVNICKKYNINKPLIADLRGALVEEMKNYDMKYSQFYTRQVLKLEMYIFKNIHFFFFMSENMQKYYLSKYIFEIENTAIFPTIVNEEYFYKSEEFRNKIRKKLYFGDKFVYAYVGGVAYWQNIDKILIKFNEVSKINTKLFLLFITNEPETVYDIIDANNLDRNFIKVISLSYEKVGEYLNAADAGLIIREDNLINYVSSPTKVNEYLSIGLKVVDRLDKIGVIDYSKGDLTYKSVKRIIETQYESYQKFIVYEK